MKKILYCICLLIIILSFVGCKNKCKGNKIPTFEIESVEPLEIGEEIKLKITTDCDNPIFEYKSSKEEVIKVNEEGVLTAISSGISNITVYLYFNDQKYEKTIEIKVLESVIPPHQHTACSECGLCTDENCPDEEAKCLGHEVIVPPHDCNMCKSDWIPVGEVVCEKPITYQIICNECERVLEEKVVTFEHNYESEVISVKTCTENGEVKYTCSICEDSYSTKEIAEGHKKSEIKILKAATSNTLGTKVIGCENCDYVYKEFQYVDNAYHANGKLSVKGSDLVNQNGEKFQLFGLSTHGLQWFSKVVNFDTFCEIQENFGNNVFRLALYTDEDGYCDGSASKKKQMLETLQRGIDIATELGLYVIVDWHMVGAENVLDKNPLTYLEEAKEFFSYISEYYKDQDNILYEIMNEPNGSTTWADCKKYANEVIPCIRKNTDAVILVGNPKWTADLNSVMADPLVGYENIMYTYHFYAADHSSTTQVVKAYDSGFPVFISEFGFMESSGDGNISETNGDKWKKVLDTRNISYVAWNISNSKGSASIFKYNTTKLDDVSDSNLKVWGVYLKNWYRAKSLGLVEEEEEENLNPTVELKIEIPEWSSSYECFIISSNHDDSRLGYDWSSTNEGVLTVSSYSTLTIVGDGTCSIICKHKTNGYVGILDITVENKQIVNWSSRYTE